MTWTNKYKKSIDCNNPKGFSQKAHCQARKLRQAGKPTKSEPIREDGHVGLVGGTPTNNVSGGDIDGIGVGPKGEPGVNMKKKRKVIPFGMFVRKPK